MSVKPLSVSDFCGRGARLRGLTLILCRFAAYLIIAATSLANPAFAGDGSSGDPFTSLTEAYSVPSSGRYYFNLGSGTFQADVDNSEGGGWVLVLQYVHQGGTNPAKTSIAAGSNLPELSPASLGANESGNAARWGHTSLAAAQQFTGDIEFRWYGETSNHTRKIHFRSSVGDIPYRSNSGNFSGIQSSFTPLTGHTGQLPAVATNFSGSGESSLTGFPFWVGGASAAIWNVGISNRWEMDDYPNNFANDTIHRVWVRDINTSVEVTNTNDSGAGSLRAAIDAANASTVLDNITFNITGGGPHVINLSSGLPSIEDDNVSIDGTTQSGTVCRDIWAGESHALQIQVNGDGTSTTLRTDNPNTTIKGLSLTNGGYGINTGLVAHNATIQCNYIGLNPDGTVNSNGEGLRINANSHLIGGPNPTDGNIISGNTSRQVFLVRDNNTVVQGNFIGPFPGGTTAPTENGGGFHNDFAMNVTIDKNLVSGNDGYGYATGPGANTNNITFTNNYFGVDRTGTAALGNSNDNIHINVSAASAAQNITIGTPGNGNILSGSLRGILVSNATGLTIQGNKIGTDISGTVDIGNTAKSIYLYENTDGTVIGGVNAGEGNVIAFADEQQVLIDGTDVTVLGNTMFGDDGAMILLGSNVTDKLNYPTVEHIAADGTTNITAQISADLPVGDYRVELFTVETDNTDQRGDAKTYFGSFDITHGGTGTEYFSATTNGVVTVLVGQRLTATVTEKPTPTTFGSTSEFGDNGLAAASMKVLNTNDSGAGSLRDAMTVVNARTGIDLVEFAIPNAGPHVITLASALPTITDDGVSIDGTTQSGASCGQLTTGTPHDLRVQIDGTSAGSARGISLNADSVVVKGLSITNFDVHGISRQTGAVTDDTIVECTYVGVAPDGVTKGSNAKSVSASFGIAFIDATNVVLRNSLVSGNENSGSDSGVYLSDITGAVIEGNIIGLNAAGTAALGNGDNGITISGTSSGITIGGTTAATRNVISGNGANGVGISTGVSNVTFLGNYIGTDINGTSAVANAAIGITAVAAPNITIGGINAGQSNLISGNTLGAIHLDATDTVDILGNRIGTNAAGTAAIPNASDTIRATNVINLNIGNGTAAGRNIISGNSGRALRTIGTATNLSINENYIGVDVSGNTALNNGTGMGAGADDPIVLSSGSNVNILNNVIGPFTGEGIEMWGPSTLNGIAIQGNHIGVGADGTTVFTSGRAGFGLIAIGAGFNAANMQIGGTGVGEGNLLGNSAGSAILFNSAAGTVSGEIVGNTVFGNAEDGINIAATNASVAIYANSIHSNGDLGIDLGTSGVTANDSGDGDTGPNDLLNFPVINTIKASGSTSVMYNVNLDVPANTEGYRIEFYKNSTGDASGHGEGETFLGFVDTGDHPGGSINFDGTFTASEIVSPGDIISTTATRKTGATSYDITSEFAANVLAADPLIVTNTNASGAGSLAAAIDYANANAAADDITFNIPTSDANYNGTYWTITPSGSWLPLITDDNVTIDASTQAGASCGDLWAGTPPVLKIRLDSPTNQVVGFHTQGNATTIKGFSITRFQQGIQLNSASVTGSTAQCNFVGLTPDGLDEGNTSRAFLVGAADGVLIGGLAAGEGNVISGNATGIQSNNGTTALSIQGNFIGTDPTGLLARPNDNRPLYHDSGAGTWSDITKNLISGNTSVSGDIGGIRLDTDDTITGSSGDVLIRGNYIGVDRTGLTYLANGGDPIFIDPPSNGFTIGGTDPSHRNILLGGEVDLRSSNMTVLGNYIGVGADGVTKLGAGGNGLHLRSSSNVTIGDGTVAGRNVIAGTGSGVRVHDMSNLTISGNYIGIAVDGSTNIAGTGSGVFVDGGGGAITITGNKVTNFGNHGVRTSSANSNIAIYSNAIYNNGGIGINLVGGTETNNVTANDSGDGDTGPNDLLNFPVINTIKASGSTSVMYNVNLDVPANTEGYRIEFYKNSTGDASGHGEGETFLGFIDTGDHPGGSINFDGTFTASEAVSSGDIISTTATRKTGATSYDMTSEFSANYTVVSALIVTNTNDSGAGSLRQAIENANADPTMDDITFAIPGAGPHTITLASDLPDITDDGVNIDGASQSGASCGDLWAGTPHTLQIQITASGLNPFRVSGDNITIKGLSITNTVNAISVLAASDNFVGQCNYIGVEPDGSASPNTGYAFRLYGSGARIGGLVAGEGNVISGNSIAVHTFAGSTDTAIRGNFIGTDPSGTQAQPNTLRALNHQSGAGTWREIRKNLISGNTVSAIVLDGDDITGSAGDVMIAGNYIGTDRTGTVALPNLGNGIHFLANTITGLTIGGINAADRNIIAGNSGNGITLTGINDIDVFGNYIGVGADGITDIGNTGFGINVSAVTDFNFGNGLASGRNIIAGNEQRTLSITGGGSNITVNGNYLGTDASGNVNIPSAQTQPLHQDDGINLNTGTFSNVAITNNVIGGFTGEAIEVVGSGHTITGLIIKGNSIGVGADGTTSLPVGVQTAQAVLFGNGINVSGLEIGGSGQGNIIANTPGTGIKIQSDAGIIIGLITENIIRDNTLNGISQLDESSMLAIYANSIFGNGDLGVDLGGDGVTANDSGDGDTGPNDLLNFPVINTITASGSTSVMYNVNLDVPANTNGYRIEFYKNSSGDSSGHGEGETFLGFVDTGDHPGGSINFDGTFTASEAVSSGDIISTTATRKTGATSYDMTSEFSANYTVVSALIVTNTNDSGAGSLRQAIENANADPTMDDITFAIPGAGPHKIMLLSSLPGLTDDGISIDGTTQSGASCGQLTTGTPHNIRIQLDGNNGAANFSLRALAPNITIRGVSVGGFDHLGMQIASSGNNVTLECNYIGVAPDGATATPNALDDGTNTALFISSVSNAIVRNNVISGNNNDPSDRGLVVSAATDVTITGNIIGLNAAGDSAIPHSGVGITVTLSSAQVTIGGTTAETRNVVSGNGSDGIYITNTSSDVTILGNYVGVDRIGTTVIANGDVGIGIAGNSSDVRVGDGTSAGRNIITGNSAFGLDIVNATDIEISGNYIGLTKSAVVIGNQDVGVRVTGTSTAAIYGNAIAGNTGLAIDLNSNGVSANDAGDADTGPNDLLNFPVINTITASGSTSVMYNVNLDVPANTEGYRIEFYKNSTGDASGHGEGETFLGFVDTGDHPGGSINFDGTFTASEAVSSGDIISTTATRKTGASSYDITSEFSANYTVVSALIVTNTNDSGAGSLRQAIENANADPTMDDITFAIPNAGPHVITLASALPYITDADITIDGATQSGASCGDLWSGTPPVLKVQLNGSTSGGYGLVANSDNITIKGLSVVSFASGLVSLPGATGTQFVCNYMGLNPDGTASGNTTSGVIPHGTNTLVGGSNPGDGNVVSGNGSVGFSVGQDVVNFSARGNFIGTDPTGLLPRPNGGIGINQFTGGTATWGDITRNLISGNGARGILLSSTTSVTGASGDVIIAGNYIGVDRTGNAALPNGSNGIEFPAGSISGVTLGGTTAADRNIISGNGGNGLHIDGTATVSILGNYIGLGQDGAAVFGNSSDGIFATNATDLVIGNGSPAGRNVISGNGDDGIELNGATTSTISGNYIGTDATGLLDRGNFDEGIMLYNSPVAIISDNVISGSSGAPYPHGIAVSNGATATIIRNKIGVGADGVTAIPNTRVGIGVELTGVATIGDGTAANGNIIAFNTGRGVSVQGSGQAAILANAIFGNGDLGIDLSVDGVTANDSGDGDSGANDLLNFPVINDFSGVGTSLSYNVNLDVPSNVEGYRIEFFKNSSADVSGHGEGEIYLGHVDTGNHAGGNLSFSGSFTGSVAINQGDIISATATRKTGASSFDITSEFSLNYSSASPTELVGSKSVSVYDPLTLGLYNLPGNDVISSLTVTNPGAAAADADSIEIIEGIPAELTFYNGDIDDAGPESNPVSFAQTGGAGLTFTYANDVRYSNSGTKPATFAACGYTPTAGYDSNVTYVCFNPKGAMSAGNPDPTFTVAYRARIK